MKVEKLPISQATGQVLLHNLVGPDGRRVLRKGRQLTRDDISKLKAAGQESVYVAILEENDINEDEAARRLGQIIAGNGIAASNAVTGRVNLTAERAGLLKVNADALLDFNDRPGITLGTLRNNSAVQPQTVIGTIKIIPYSVPKDTLAAAEAIAQNTPLIRLIPFVVKQAALITTGSPEGREKVVTSFTRPLRERLAQYNTTLLEGPYVAEDEDEIRAAIHWALGRGVEMVLIAGETSIMDTDDITPRAIRAVGGNIVHHGVPVEPGNLLLLAYYNNIPIVGAPGCARSPSYNVVDMVLPRLAAGEQLSRRDLVELGHGGYLK